MALLGDFIVSFMQAGFARAKNALNIIMKKLMNFAIGSVIFWFIGFRIIFAESHLLVRGVDLLTQGSYTEILQSVAPKEVFYIT